MLADASKLPVASVALAIFLLMVQPAPSFSLSTYNLADYPWLQTGTYAKYWSVPMGNPSFVMPNGSLMIALSGEAHSVANMSWIVTLRTGDTVYLTLNYSISGAESTENDAKYLGRTTPFNFSTSLRVVMDVQTRMTYVNGKPEGIIDLWADPVPSVGQSVSLGTVFVAGQAYNITSKINTLSDCASGSSFGGPIESQGKVYYCVKYYYLEDDSFGTPDSSRFGWLNVSSSGNIPTVFPPIGLFDYYTGLAIQSNFLDFPINQTVCHLVNGSPASCSYVSFGTALGEYLRSDLGLMLSSTNAPLVPTQTGGTSEIPWLLVTSGISLVVSSSALVYLYRRRSRTGPG